MAAADRKLTRAEKLEALRARRAKTNFDDDSLQYNLGIMGSRKNPDLAYRWINDNEKSRLHVLTKSDTWDFVESDELGLDERNTDTKDSRISRIVGTNKDGSPMRSYLCCKPKEWVSEDRARRVKPHREVIRQINERQVSGPLAGAGDRAYVAKEATL
jgi:hypothetical protein